MTWVWGARLLGASAAAVPVGGRVLHGFETSGEFGELRRDSADCALEPSQDFGVTQGRQCARLVVAQGSGWSELRLGAAARAGWQESEVLALDVYAEEGVPATSVTLELWDSASKDYASRCTLDAPVRPGRQTVMWRIDRARRNRREALSWEELTPDDKIDRSRLTRVKILFVRTPQSDQRFWIDNLRLLRDQDLCPRMDIIPPPGSVGFDFGAGQPAVAGFHAVAASNRYTMARGRGMMETNGLMDGGSGWPDPLCGTYVRATDRRTFRFEAAISNGEYLVWLCAGPIIRPDGTNCHFLLRLNDRVLVDQDPSVERFYGEEFLYRFLGTRYSLREDALREDYLRRMYPVWKDQKIVVQDGQVRLTAQNCFVSALILVPASNATAYSELTAALDREQAAMVSRTWHSPPAGLPRSPSPHKAPWQVFIPEPGAVIKPWTRIDTRPAPRGEIRCAVAPGQNAFLRVAVTGWNGEETGQLTLGALQGPAVIPVTSISSYVQNYRAADGDVTEMCLLPATTCRPAYGQTVCFWLWLRVADTTPGGRYRGRFLFETPSAPPVSIPVELEVHPFRLVRELPAAFGMYYGEPGMPSFPEPVRKQKLREQVEWMRQIGFTSMPVGGPVVTGGSIAEGGGRVTFDSFWFELAREAGMGRTPDQRLMANSLGMARGIGKRLPGMSGAPIDRDPGLELRQPGFLPLYKDALRQYKEFLDRMGLPVAVEVVDEPREMPNPWNRNLKDTLTYAGLLREARIPAFVTPMGDRESGLDYTELAANVDVLSTHGWEQSAGLRAKAAQEGKTLWLYNLGLSRLSWGFFPWRCGAKGRWEWHFCWPEDRAMGGYPGREWYNPFTGMDGLAPSAPYAGFHGGMLFKSDFFQIAEGIADYAYLCTLEESIARRRAAGANQAQIVTAEKLLEEIRRAVPLYLPASGSATGGITDGQLDTWRARIAEQLNLFHESDTR